MVSTRARGAVVLLVAVAPLACGGGSGRASAEDGGRDGPAREDASSRRDGGDAHDDGGASPRDASVHPDAFTQHSTGGELVDAGTDVTASSGVAAYCALTVSTVLRCGEVSRACIRAELDAGSLDAAVTRYVDECAAVYAEVLSGPYAQAYADCFGTAPCCLVRGTCEDAGAAFNKTFDECVAAKLANLPPDRADQKVRSDFCETCPDMDGGLPACAGFFSFAEAGVRDGAIPDGWTTSAASLGFGTFLFATTDPVVKQVDEACTGAALATFDGGSQLGGGCYGRFVGCAQSITTAAVKPLGRATDASVPAACLPDGG